MFCFLLDGSRDDGVALPEDGSAGHVKGDVAKDGDPTVADGDPPATDGDSPSVNPANIDPPTVANPIGGTDRLVHGGWDDVASGNNDEDDVAGGGDNVVGGENNVVGGGDNVVGGGDNVVGGGDNVVGGGDNFVGSRNNVCGGDNVGGGDDGAGEENIVGGDNVGGGGGGGDSGGGEDDIGRGGNVAGGDDNAYNVGGDNVGEGDGNKAGGENAGVGGGDGDAGGDNVAGGGGGNLVGYCRSVVGMVLKYLPMVIAVHIYLLSSTDDHDSSLTIGLADLETKASMWQESEWLNIVLIGKPGIGKSTLAVSFFGEAEIYPTPEEISPLTVRGVRKNDVMVKLHYWQSDVKYSHNMAEHLKTVDLVLYAIRMDDTRFRPADEEAVQELSKFGSNLWDKSIFALTLANRVGFMNSKNKLQRNRVKFEKKRNEWKEKFHKVLSENGITDEVINGIPFVPVGHHTEPTLHNKQWMTHFVKCMLIRIRETGVGGLWKATKDHAKMVGEEEAIKCTY